MIGIFDSGFGGLTILQQIRSVLPEYDYLYLGDNARAPYGTRSFECIYRYTLEAVQYLFDHGCSLVILACNTASAKALRTIQQNDLPRINSLLSSSNNTQSLSPLSKGARGCLNVLGVIRPTVEVVPSLTRSGHVGVLATPGTVASDSYRIELEKQDSSLIITQQACPMWVPLIEAGEHLNPGADYFVDLYLQEILNRDPLIDTLVLGCTHYPLLLPKIEAALKRITAELTANGLSQGSQPCVALPQGRLVADSLADYLRRHPEYEAPLTRGGSCRYLTTDDASRFEQAATLFLGEPIQAEHVEY